MKELTEKQIMEAFDKEPILKETTRMTIRIDDVSIGMSVKKRESWGDDDIVEVLEELIRMLKAPTLEDKELI